jgi:hypothetical protein
LYYDVIILLMDHEALPRLSLLEEVTALRAVEAQQTAARAEKAVNENDALLAAQRAAAEAEQQTQAQRRALTAEFVGLLMLAGRQPEPIRDLPGRPPVQPTGPRRLDYQPPVSTQPNGWRVYDDPTETVKFEYIQGGFGEALTPTGTTTTENYLYVTDTGDVLDSPRLGNDALRARLVDFTKRTRLDLAAQHNA